MIIIQKNKKRHNLFKMTIDSIIKFKGICDKLSLDIKSKDDFDKRFLIQKIFYFLKVLGIDFDFKYNFFKYGPYSEYLTDHYYSILEIPEGELEKLPKITINEKEEELLKKAKNILNKWGNDFEKLEFYSSVLYVLKDMYIKDRNPEKVEKVLEQLKPDLFKKFVYKKVVKELMTEGLSLIHI